MDADSPAGRKGAATDPVAARHEVTKLVNTQIRVIAESDVLAHGSTNEAYGFLCECGCMKMVELPLSVYDAEGAWLEGHKPD